MKKCCLFYSLVNVILLCNVVVLCSKNAQAYENYQQEENVVEEKEENSNTTASRKIISIGTSSQRYTGEYRDLTKNSFKKDNEIVDVAETRSVFVGVGYEYQLNVARVLNPYVGLDFSFSIPFSKQDNQDSFKSYTGNFVDVKFKLGNSFVVVKKFLDINVYATAGFASSVYYGQNIGKGNYANNSVKSGISITLGGVEMDTGSGDNSSKPEFRFAYGYVYGCGLDFVFGNHLSVGGFYEQRKMQRGHEEHYINKYQNNTFGIKVGFVF